MHDGSNQLISTSWDDGHPLDLRLAELLAKHEIRGTFYIPRKSQRPTISEAEVRSISQGFEIGAHTLDHLTLPELSRSEATSQISGSKDWIEHVTGRACKVFCPPCGRFTKADRNSIYAAGFAGFRTVELLAVNSARMNHQLAELPTTIQVCNHSARVYLRNALRRHSVRGVWRIVRDYRPAWNEYAKRLLRRYPLTLADFHLWGHSWEIDEQGLWKTLDQFLAHLSNQARETGSRMVTNGEICDVVRSGMPAPSGMPT